VGAPPRGESAFFMESLRGYAVALAATAACTALGLLMRGRFDTVNIAMVYLLAVVLVALRYSRGAAVLTALASVAALDLVFVPPHGAFTVQDAQYILTFAIMVTVGLVISGLTHRIREQAEARARLAIQAETERVRSALLASISHDLRTPLAVMAGASSMLADRGERMDAADRQALARSLFGQCREMSERVSKVLQMTRLEVGAMELRRDWASLSEIGASVLRNLEDRIAAHNVVVEMPADLPLARVDAALIEQAIANLLENAGRHTPAGTTVRLVAAVRGDEIVVSIEDHGPGMPEEDLERVFSKFQHGSMAGAAGMGLGLAISRAIVALHQGRAWAEPMAGGGIAFRFALPLEANPAVPAEAES
jgi:two-component system, OmpR family, sensor histidine kinase KdpD